MTSSEKAAYLQSIAGLTPTSIVFKAFFGKEEIAEFFRVALVNTIITDFPKVIAQLQVDLKPLARQELRDAIVVKQAELKALRDALDALP